MLNSPDHQSGRITLQFVKAGLLASFLALGLAGLTPALAADKPAAAAATPASKADAPASEASIRELMEITHSRKMLDDMMANVQAMLRKQIQQTTPESGLNEKQKQILNDMQAKMVKLFTDDMKWENMEPVFIEIYQKTFTQGDIDDLITFYKSKTGQKMLAKMPLIVQNSMQIMQDRMQSLIPKLQQIEADTQAQLKAAREQNPEPNKPRKN